MAIELIYRGSSTGAVKSVNGKTGDIILTAEDIGAVNQNYVIENDIPKVFFTGNTNLMTKENAVDLEFSYRSLTDNFDGYVEIKWQGNSSVNYDKKNYTIKIYADKYKTKKLKKDIRGWGKQNKYCLKANYIDCTHARNITNANLWSEIVSTRSNYDTLPEQYKNSPNNGAVDGFPIKLYMNGIYQGIYTWNIPKDDWMFNMDSENPNHCVLCAETNDDTTSCNFQKEWDGVDGEEWSVEVGTNSAEIINSFNALINCVKDTDDETFKSTIGNHLDIESAIDYYIFQQVLYGLDGMAKNLLMATYDGVKWICCAYDLDSTWGLYWNGTKLIPAKEGVLTLFSKLWQRISTLFADEVAERYTELRKNIYTSANIVTKFEGFIDTIGSELYAEDLTIFPDIPSPDVNNINWIRQFVVERLDYVDTLILGVNPIYELSETILDGTGGINTGIDLNTLDEYTVTVDYTISEEQDITKQYMILDNIHATALSGWGILYNSSSPYGFVQNNGWTGYTAHSGTQTDPRGIRNQAVIRKKLDGTMSVITSGNTKYTDVFDFTINSDNNMQFLYIGGNLYTDGMVGSFAKVTIHSCKVYKVALSDNELKAYANKG